MVKVLSGTTRKPSLKRWLLCKVLKEGRGLCPSYLGTDSPGRRQTPRGPCGEGTAYLKKSHKAIWLDFYVKRITLTVTLITDERGCRLRSGRGQGKWWERGSQGNKRF